LKTIVFTVCEHEYTGLGTALTWTSDKLSLNTAKTKFILFKSSNKGIKHNTIISRNGKPIKQVKNTTFLSGVVINEHLTWNDHIDLITKKLSYKIYRNNIQDLTFHKF
jgi:hypothetical protein